MALSDLCRESSDIEKPENTHISKHDSPDAYAHTTVKSKSLNKQTEPKTQNIRHIQKGSDASDTNIAAPPNFTLRILYTHMGHYSLS